MANTARKTTLEDAWGIIREVGEAQKETDRQLKETDRQLKETDRQLKETNFELKEAQKETVRQLKETNFELKEAQKETDRQLKETSFELKEAQKETDRQLKETSFELKEAQKETDRQLKETDRQLKESSFELKEAVKKTMRSVDKTNGNFNSKWGTFLEDLVEGDLVNLLNKREIQVAKINSRVKYLRPDNSVGAEYDLIAVNGSEIVVFEIKTTLSIENLNTFVEKLIKFRGHFPEYSDKKIYGGIAYMKADRNSDKLAIEEGLFLIKAPGGATNVSTLINSDDFSPKSF